MKRAVAEVSHLFGMLEGPGCVGALTFVASIGAGSGVATFQIARKRRIADSACETAVADAQKFAIPARCRQPDFKVDIGIRGRGDAPGNAAEFRKIFERLSIRRTKRTGRSRLRK